MTRLAKMLAVMAVTAVLTPIAAADDDSFGALLESVEEIDRCLDSPECAARQEAERERKQAATQAAQVAAAKARDAAARERNREPKTIRLGDSSEYVELQWGKPERVDRMVSGHGTHEWWWYDGSNAVHFANGLVDAIHSGR